MEIGARQRLQRLKLYLGHPETDTSGLQIITQVLEASEAAGIKDRNPIQQQHNALMPLRAR